MKVTAKVMVIDALQIEDNVKKNPKIRKMKMTTKKFAIVKVKVNFQFQSLETDASKKIEEVKITPKAKKELKKFSNVKRKANFQFVTTVNDITCVRKTESLGIVERSKNAIQTKCSTRARKSA